MLCGATVTKLISRKISEQQKISYISTLYVGLWFQFGFMLFQCTLQIFVFFLWFTNILFFHKDQLVMILPHNGRFTFFLCNLSIWPVVHRTFLENVTPERVPRDPRGIDDIAQIKAQKLRIRSWYLQRFLSPQKMHNLKFVLEDLPFLTL